VSRTSIDIRTADGTCSASLFHPAGNGPWPGVIFYMDGPGIRPVRRSCKWRCFRVVSSAWP